MVTGKTIGRLLLAPIWGGLFVLALPIIGFYAIFEAIYLKVRGRYPTDPEGW